jgi:two-component system nitrogen regulation response regulator GlnG
MPTDANIIVADDDAAIRTVLSQALGRAGYQVRSTGNAATLWRWVSQGEGDLVITDVVMPDENAFDLLPRIKKLRPDLPVIVMSAQNTFMTAIRASERGAYDYLPKPFDLKELVAIVGRAVTEPKERAESGRLPDADSIPLVGRSPAMQDIYRVLARLMQTDLTVMITGESGTGKELVARALHDYGKRRHGPFVAINMAAIPRELIESELFGHERGAFTGAQARSMGRFEQAEGGTLFLDEIGADGGADATAARAAAGRVHDRRRSHADQDRRAHRRRHQQGPARADPAGPLSRRPVLPPERRADPPAAAAGTY